MNIFLQNFYNTNINIYNNYRKFVINLINKKNKIKSIFYAIILKNI